MNKTVTIAILLAAALLLVYPYLGISKESKTTNPVYLGSDEPVMPPKTSIKPSVKSDNTDQHKLSDIEDLLQK